MALKELTVRCHCHGICLLVPKQLIEIPPLLGYLAYNRIIHAVNNDCLAA